MPILRVFLFGGVSISFDDAIPANKLTRVTQTLLAYLILHRQRAHPREVLISILWGDQSEKRARNCLNTALWRLRSILEPEGIHKGAYLFTTPSGEIGFNNESNYWVDTVTLETNANNALAKPVNLLQESDVQDLQHALHLYHGDLMEGFYDDWTLRERERLRDLYLQSLAHLMHYYWSHHQFTQGIACGQQILAYDPLREEIHRDVMRIYVDMGERPLAVRQYENCLQVLETELGIPPMEETQALLKQIAPEVIRNSIPKPLKTNHLAVDLALHQLRSATHYFREAQANLRNAIEQIEQLKNG